MTHSAVTLRSPQKFAHSFASVLLVVLQSHMFVTVHVESSHTTLRNEYAAHGKCGVVTMVTRLSNNKHLL